MQKGGVPMFRDLARMTASLKGPRYEGALIAKAVWECGHDAGTGMHILRDHHGLLEVMAFDDSGRLTLTMLLGRPALRRRHECAPCGAKAACAGAGHSRSRVAGHRAGAPCGAALPRRILCRRDHRAVCAAAHVNAGSIIRVLLCAIRQPSAKVLLTIKCAYPIIRGMYSTEKSEI